VRDAEGKELYWQLSGNCEEGPREQFEMGSLTEGILARPIIVRSDLPDMIEGTTDSPRADLHMPLAFCATLLLASCYSSGTLDVQRGGGGLLVGPRQLDSRAVPWIDGDRGVAAKALLTKKRVESYCNTLNHAYSCKTITSIHQISVCTADVVVVRDDAVGTGSNHSVGNIEGTPAIENRIDSAISMDYRPDLGTVLARGGMFLDTDRVEGR
jgi:hypothetical protein